MLSDVQIDRYSRQIILPEVGAHGQALLLSAAVALVDAGGDVRLVLLYLAAAGVGHVELWTGIPSRRWERLASDVRDLNGDCKIEIRELGVDRFAASDTDLVVLAESGTGHGQIGGRCWHEGRTLIWSRAQGGTGYLAVVDAISTGACYDCAVADLPRNEAVSAAGISASAVLASVQAGEAIKHILRMPSALRGSMLQVDVLRGQITTSPMTRRAGCPACDTRPAS
jgi:adenylyltransferase/sulfurtransferase